MAYLPHKLNVWLQFDETIEVPRAAYYFEFGVNSYYGTTIYVDDCHITDIGWLYACWMCRGESYNRRDYKKETRRIVTEELEE